MSDIVETAMSLQHRLDTLRAEHREIDDTISLLGHTPVGDELAVRRLKKRKLLLKDRIALIERILTPETLA